MQEIYNKLSQWLAVQAPNVLLDSNGNPLGSGAMVCGMKYWAGYFAFNNIGAPVVLSIEKRLQGNRLGLSHKGQEEQKKILNQWGLWVYDCECKRYRLSPEQVARIRQENQKFLHMDSLRVSKNWGKIALGCLMMSMMAYPSADSGVMYKGCIWH